MQDRRMSRSAKMRSSLAIGAVLALLAAGCGGDDDASSGTQASSGTDASSGAQTSPDSTASSPDKQVTIAFALTQSGEAYYETARSAALDAGKKDGKAKVVVQGPANPTATNMTKIAQDLQTSLRPDGFATNPCILEAWTRLLRTLPKEVPNGNVLAWNCKAVNAPDEQSPVKTFVGVNDAKSAEQAVEVAVKGANLDEQTTGTAIVATCQKGVTILDQRQSAALAAVKRLLPNVEAVDLVTNAQQGPNTAAWTSAFTKYQDVVFALGTCGQDAASLTTLKNRGDGGDFVMGVFDATGRQLQLIKDGKINVGLSTQPWVIANVATRLLIDGARGAQLPEGWIDTGSQAITKDNVDEWLAAEKSPEAASAFFGPLADEVMENLAEHTHPIADAFGS